MIFVFGSNLDGFHDGGAARFAAERCGAVRGVGEGLIGSSYAIPTLGSNFSAIHIEDVGAAITRFMDFAARRMDMTFKVTRIGCGIAGYHNGDIAPMFNPVLPNCLFDEAWKPYLSEDAQFWGTL
jgi:hypothetical protein